ncbi:PTS sugar transporter subunit IIA [Lacticaseibacillus sp. GG6-2]
MFGLLKKQVLVNVTLKDPTELTALARLASFAGEKLDLASQELRSGFLASEAQGAHVIADHVAVTHASSASVKQPEVVMMTLATPLAWGENAQVDTVVAVVVPASGDTDAVCAQLLANVDAQQEALSANATAGELEKVRRQLL